MSKAGCQDLSVREMHVLEAVDTLDQQGQNRMSDIAAHLAISMGALTTSVNVLVRKGYLFRESGVKDRRIVYVKLTGKGQQAAAIHREFHQKMIDSLEKELNDEEWDTLVHSLEALETFFVNADEKRKGNG